MKSPARILTLLLTTAALFYAFLLPRFAVGSYGDDALYILGAQSLLQGRYVQLQRPTEPPMNDPLPGYPLFLAPFVKLSEGHLNALKGVALLLVLLCVGLTGVLSRFWLSPPESLLLMAFLAFNPTTVNFSGRLMSEPCFLAMALGVFWGLYRILKQEDSWTPWATGLLMGWAVLVRPQGIVLLPAIGLGLAYARRWRAMVWVMGLPLIVWSAILLRNYTLTQSATGYLRHWQTDLSLLGSSRELLQNGYQVLKTLYVESVWAYLWLTPGAQVITTLLTLASLGVTAVGVYSLGTRHDPVGGAMTLGIASFTLFYFLIHSLWSAISPHYFFPLLPFVGLFFIEGLKELSQRFRLRRIGWVVGMFFLICYGVQDVFALRQAASPPFENRIPRQTLRWIAAQLPANSQVLAVRSSVVYLYTKRHALPLVWAQNAEEYHQRLLRLGVTHVMFEPVDILFVHTTRDFDPATMWERSLDWAQSSPAAFRLVYENLEERTRMYEVLAY